MKISFITTVFNEEESIAKLLDSLVVQSKMPEEIVIVDGGSTDNTLSVISNFQFSISNKNVKILKKKGNRSVGRNTAIRNTSGDIIVCSDAGCVLDKNWVKNIIKSFSDPQVDVVAGYYKGLAKDSFQKCLIPYVLVMPDKIDPENFLPAARSMAFRKSIWKKSAGFPEQFSDNEDYVFARNLKRMKAKIFFEKDAIVYWIPRKSFREAYSMFFRFASGDAEARILRGKVLLVFLRYFIGLIIFSLFFIFKSYFILYTLYFILVIYCFWAIGKNYKYVKNLKAIFILPLLQFVADLAVMAGTISGVYKIWVIKRMS